MVYKYGRNIPEFVKRYRETYSLSQWDLANKLGVHAQYVSNIERGLNKNSVSFCKKLMKVLKPQQRDALVELLSEQVAEDASHKMMER